MNQNLTPLAGQINAAHELACSTARLAVQQAREAGDLLITAKAGMGHGEWIPWLKTNLCFPERTAQRYMRLASEWGGLASRSPTLLSDLTVTAALKLLTKPKDDAPAPEVPTLAEVLAAQPRSAWIGPFDDGVRFLTPSAEHPGHVFVDEVDIEKGEALVARRPFRIDALAEFFPGTSWVRHDEIEDWRSFMEECFPERKQDLVALGIPSAS